MPACQECGSSVFLVEDGYYYCQMCSTQSQDMRESIYEESTILFSKKLQLKRRCQETENEDTGDENTKLWISYEAYNIILRKWVDELCQLGASKHLKDVVIQLWALYLKEIGVAFISTKQDPNPLPRFTKGFRLRDVHAIYGKCMKKVNTAQKRNRFNLENISEMQQKKTRARIENTYIESELEALAKTDSFGSPGDQKTPCSTPVTGTADEVENVDDQDDESSKLLIEQLEEQCNSRSSGKSEKRSQASLIKLLSMLYLGLLYLEEDILLCDVIRFIREKKLSLCTVKSLLPDWMRKDDTFCKQLLVSRNYDARLVNYTAFGLVKFLALGQFPSQPVMPIVKRLVAELQLPEMLVTFIENLVEANNPKKILAAIQKRELYRVVLPVPEGAAMALIVISLKLLFGIDGKTEKENSLFASCVNKHFLESQYSLSPDSIADQSHSQGATARTYTMPLRDWLGEKSYKMEECFVWDNWAQYIQFRKFVMSQENFQSWTLLHDLNSYGGQQLIDFTTHQLAETAADNMFTSKKVIQGDCSEVCFPAVTMCGSTVGADPSFLSCNVTLLPYTEFVREYLGKRERHEKVCSPDIVPDLLYSNFHSKSLNFVTNPELYQAFLEDRNVKVQIIPGIAQENRVKIKRIPKSAYYHTPAVLSTKSETEVQVSTAMKRVSVDNVSSTGEHTKSQETETSSLSQVKLYLPYSEYWLNEAVFYTWIGSVKKTNDKLMKTLPESFIWLLETCSRMIEMTPEGLYIEVRSVENILFPGKEKNISYHCFEKVKGEIK